MIIASLLVVAGCTARVDRTYLMMDADELTPVSGVKLTKTPCRGPLALNLFPPRGDSGTSGADGKVTLHEPRDHYWNLMGLESPGRSLVHDPLHRLPRPDGIEEIYYLRSDPPESAR